jgi:hypothetical protein
VPRAPAVPGVPFIACMEPEAHFALAEIESEEPKLLVHFSGALGLLADVQRTDL